MTMKGKPDIYADKSSQLVARRDKKGSSPGDTPSGDEASLRNSQDGISSPIRTGSVTGSDCELKSSSGSSSDEEPNTFEGLLKICGEAGPWQLQIFLLTSFVGFCTALHNLIYAFIGAIPDHWCHLPNVTSRYTENELKDLLIPSHKNKNNETIYETCKEYSYFWNDTQNNFIVDQNEINKCDQVDFDFSTFKNTIVTDWDLVCDETFWASAVQATYMFGILCGSPIFGAVSDKLGRKRSILISTIIFVVAGPLVALSPNFGFVMATRFLLAFGSPGIYGTSFVLAIEILAPSWRGLAGNLFCLPFALGYMVLPGVAYLIRDWKILQLVLSAPSVLLFLTWYFLPESPRWLLRKGRVQEAEAILRNAAERNGRKKELPVDFSEIVARIGECVSEKEHVIDQTWKKRVSGVLSGYANLLRSPKMRLRTLVIYVCWASISLTYYGIALNSPNLSTDRYLYTFIGGVLEVPSYFMVPPLIRLLGRKPAFSGFLFVCSAALFSSLLFEEGSPIIVALSLFGKFIIGGAYALVYLYATELMPTLLRTYGLGTASMVGRVGSIIAPFVVDLVGKDNKTYPSIVFGCVSLVAGCLSLLLPETRNRRLPETVEDVELGRV